MTDKQLERFKDYIATEMLKMPQSANPEHAKMLVTGIEIIFKMIERMERIEAKVDAVRTRTSLTLTRLSALKRASKQGKHGMHERKTKRKRKGHFKTI